MDKKHGSSMGITRDDIRKANKKRLTKKFANMSEAKLQRKKARKERRDAGEWWMKKKKKKELVLANRAKERSKTNLETIKNKEVDEAVGYTEAEKALQEPLILGSESPGGSMSYKKKGASMKNKQERKDLLKYNPVVDKSKGMGGAGMYGKKDGMSMYGKKHGSSMNKYDKDMMHERELIYDAKKEIHKEDMAKKAHAHPIFKHMRKF